MSARLHEDDATRDAFVAAMADRPTALTPAEREAVRAIYVERRSVRDAARHLGVNVSLLQERISRARRWLRAWEAHPRAA